MHVKSFFWLSKKKRRMPTKKDTRTDGRGPRGPLDPLGRMKCEVDLLRRKIIDIKMDLLQNNGVFEPEGAGTSPMNSVSDSKMCDRKICPKENKYSFYLSNQ